MTDCTCKLEPGIYRVHSDGSIQHVTKVVVTHAPLGWAEGCLIVVAFSIVILIGALFWKSLNKSLKGEP